MMLDVLEKTVRNNNEIEGSRYGKSRYRRKAEAKGKTKKGYKEVALGSMGHYHPAQSKRPLHGSTATESAACLDHAAGEAFQVQTFWVGTQYRVICCLRELLNELHLTFGIQRGVGQNFLEQARFHQT